MTCIRLPVSAFLVLTAILFAGCSTLPAPPTEEVVDHLPTRNLTFNAIPSKGHAPLDVTFHVFWVGESRGCSSGPSYDFGDGTKQYATINSCIPLPVTPFPTPTVPASYSYSTVHRYEQAGTYHATMDLGASMGLTIVVQ